MKTLFIESRQTGKTGRAIYEFLKNPKESLLVFHNNNQVSDIKKRIGNHDNIITSSQFLNKDDLRDIKTLILDEWFCMNNYIQIYNKSRRIENVIVFGTPNKVYNSELFNRVVSLRSRGYTIGDVDYYLNEDKVKFNIKELHHVFYNFLTDPSFTIVKNMNGFCNDNHYYEKRKDCKKYMSDVQYKLEIECNYLSEEFKYNNTIVDVKPLGPPSGLLFYYDYKYTSDELKHFTEL